MTGSIFETFCFPLILGLCLWWFAVVQAAGLDAFLAGGLDAFLASYNCFYGWSGRFPGQLQLFFMDSKGDGKHF